jgi:hypothetical protein
MSRPEFISGILSKIHELAGGPLSHFYLTNRPHNSVYLATSHNLINQGIVTGILSLKMTYVENRGHGVSTLALGTANNAAKQALVSIEKIGPSEHLSSLSARIDASSSAMAMAQQSSQDIEQLSPFVGPLAQALSSLDRIVAMVDGLAEVSWESIGDIQSSHPLPP